MTKSNLDILFVARFGKRNTSSIVEAIQSTYGEELTDAELTALAAVIVEVYSPKWNRMAEIYDIEYDPIHNYLDEWEDTNTGSDSNTRTLDTDVTMNYGETQSTTNTRTDNLTSATTGSTTASGSTNVGDSTYGFNSDTAVNKDASATSTSDESTNTTTTTDTGTVGDVGSLTKGGSDSKVSSGTITDEGADQRDRSGKHYGNIGNLTSQKMIKEEIDLWRWKYVDEILNDVREFCTIPAYRLATRFELVDQD